MHQGSLIYQNLTPITDKFNGVLLDAYGVFWGGNDVGIFPGSKEMMEKLVSGGKIVGILSNSTQLAAKEIEKYRRHGILEGRHYHFLITSGEVARALFLNESLPFLTQHKKFWVFSGGHPRFASHEALFKDTPYVETMLIDEADFIFTGIPHMQGEDQTDPEVFRSKIEDCIGKKLPLICANPDRFAHEGNPPKAVVRQGSIAELYERMGGQAYYIGKPYDKVYAMAMNKFQQQNIMHPHEIVMVGDTPETDIRGARLFGLKSALITETGIMSERVAKHGLEHALKDLSPQDHPDYFIGRFAHDL